MDIRLKDVLVMKKPHPCGDKRWLVVRSARRTRQKIAAADGIGCRFFCVPGKPWRRQAHLAPNPKPRCDRLFRVGKL